MFVGIDVHKHQHAAALIDERGGELATLTVPNSPQGYHRLLGWLGEHDAEQAVVGVESPGSYGRQLVGALAAAGLEVLHVPAWRTHRERQRQGPGKTDPGDALAIADVVRRKQGQLSPAMEPELVRALAMLELQRRRFVRDRTQAIQRLRSDWTQQDPVGEAGALRCNCQRELRRLKRIRFGDSLTDQIAARCIRELARDIEDLNQRIAALDNEIAELLNQHDNPLADLQGAGTNLTATIIAQAGDVRLPRRCRLRALLRRRADPLRLRPNRRPPPPPPRRQPTTQRRALPHRHRPTTTPPPSQSLPRPQGRRRPDPPRSTTRPQTPPRQRPLPPAPHLGRRHPGHERLDIGESSASSRPGPAAGHTARSTAPPPDATARYPAGSPTTTSPDDTTPSATNPPQLAYTS
jgi:transposase